MRSLLDEKLLCRTPPLAEAPAGVRGTDTIGETGLVGGGVLFELNLSNEAWEGGDCALPDGSIGERDAFDGAVEGRCFFRCCIERGKFDGKGVARFSNLEVKRSRIDWAVERVP